MKTRAGPRWIFLLALLGVVSLLVTGLKYWFWERTPHAGPSPGHRIEMPLAGVVFTSAFDTLYFPARELLRPAAKNLPVGGVAIDAVADFVAVTGENALLIGGWLAFRSRRNEERAHART